LFDYKIFCIASKRQVSGYKTFQGAEQKEINKPVLRKVLK
jgi:hypothetical protein